MNQIKIGFWKDRHSPEHLNSPMPVEKADEHSDKSEILKRLTLLESESREVRYRGWSNCRICGESNGSGEFHFIDKESKVEYVWPEGYRHYLDKHNVEPNQKLLKLIHLKS